MTNIPRSAPPINRSADAIIAALGGNPDTGMCRCPAHDDKTPSLHVSEGYKGAVWRCFAGCSQDAVLAALRARGLLPQNGNAMPRTNRRQDERDDGEDELERFRRAMGILRAVVQAKAGPPTDYLESRGIKLMPECAMLLPAKESARLTGKRFPAMVLPIITDGLLTGAHITWLTPDMKGKCAMEAPRRTYGFLKGGFVCCAPPDPHGSLVVGEGMESTLSAMQLAELPGVAALSANNMSAVRLPACKEVIIASDADEVGRKAAAQLAERLEYEGHKVRVARPPIEGADWNDRLCADEQRAKAEWRASLAATEPTAAPISALNEEEFMALTFPKRELYLEPWLPRPGLVMVHAPKGEGKTWFVLGVGKAIAAGQDLMTWKCSNYARVLYVDGELPGGSLQERLDKFRRSPPGMFHVLCRDTFLLRRQMMPDLGTAEGRQEIDRIIEACRPDVIILDSQSTLVRSGTENEAESWAPIQDWFLKHRWLGRTVILVCHENKAHKPRGTSKREDVMDTMVGLKKSADDDESAFESVFELTFTKTRDFYGDDAAAMRLRFAIEDGIARWSGEKQKDVRCEKIREMLDAGMKQKDIAKEIGVKESRMSQIVREMKAGGKVVRFPRKREEG
jgi:putative DNA primase/helicase